MKGPPPKSTKRKELAGTARPDRKKTAKAPPRHSKALPPLIKKAKAPAKKTDASPKKLSSGRSSKHKKALIPPAALTEVTSDRPPSYHEPPATLDHEGQKVYRILVKHLQSVDSLWAIDVFLIEQAAYWKSVHIKMTKEIERLGLEGMVQTFSTGTRQISPELQVLEKAEVHTRKYFELLGIGPKSREAIGVFNTTGGSESQDPFKALLQTYETDDAEVVHTDSGK